MAAQYISTVVPAGYERYAIRMGGAVICVIDVPAHQGPYAAGLARRWLMGETLPDGVTVWPAGGA